MADDYEYLPMVHSMSLPSFMHIYWNGVTDRYSNGVWEFATVRLLGTAALEVMPLVLLAALAGFLVATVRTVAGRVGIAASPLEWLALGLLAAVALVGTAPSLLDTIAWFNSVGFYLTSVVAFAGVVTWITRATISPRRPLAVDAGIAGVIAAIAAGFMEAETAIAAAAGVAALVTAWRFTTSGRFKVLVMAASLGAVIGLIVILAGPGSAERGQFQHAHISLGTTFPSIVHNARFVLHDVRNATVLLPIALGLFASRLLGSADPPTRRRSAIWGAFMIVVPLIIVALMTTYAGSTEGGVAPYRAAFLMTFAAALGVALLTYAVACSIRLEAYPLVASAALVVLTGVGVAALYHQARPVMHAEAKYASRLAQRAALISSELKAGDTTITLLPAPLLYQRTQAFDLAFDDPHHHDSGSWLLRFMPRYYGIPGNDRIEVPTIQPPTYCLPGVAVPWAGVASCEQLLKS
jgi:hypothetical protein